MRLTKGQIHNAGMGLAQIFNRPRQIPQTAKFKLSQIHRVLFPMAEEVEKRRNELVQSLGSERKDEKDRSLGWAVPDEKLPEYRAAWEAIQAEVVEDVKVTPVTLAMLGDSPDGIEAHEFTLLGPLVVENT